MQYRLGVFWGSRKDEKWRSGYQTRCNVIVAIRECNGEC